MPICVGNEQLNSPHVYNTRTAWALLQMPIVSQMKKGRIGVERLTPQIGQVPGAQGVRTFATGSRGRYDNSQDHPLRLDICVQRSPEPCWNRALPRDRAG